MRDRQSLVEADHLAEPGAHTDVATTALTQNAPYRLNTLPTEVATVPPNTQVSSRPASPAILAGGRRWSTTCPVSL